MLFISSHFSVWTWREDTKLWPLWISHVLYFLLKLSITTCTAYADSVELFMLVAALSKNICINATNDLDKSGESLFKATWVADVGNILWQTIISNLLKQLVCIGCRNISLTTYLSYMLSSIEHIWIYLFNTSTTFFWHEKLSPATPFSSKLTFCSKKPWLSNI